MQYGTAVKIWFGIGRWKTWRSLTLASPAPLLCLRPSVARCKRKWPTYCDRKLVDFSTTIIIFEFMDIGILLAVAIHTSYPPVHMAFAIQQHVAPRISKLTNFLGSPIEVYNSIIAGCRQRIPMTRVYLQRGIDNVTNNSNKELVVKPSVLDGVLPNNNLELARSHLHADDCAQTLGTRMVE